METAGIKTAKLIERPPVIVVMGHIDHGKSTLLDYIRKTNVAEKEVGGITQNISAYEVIHNNKKITFLDTPGHEAFSRLRGRGAGVADISILVVSAEDGVKPQTVEAYKQIQELKLPFVVAINKIDKENANVERTKQSLLENQIYVEGSGGDTPVVSISAKTGEGVPELLDLLNLISQIEELRANPDLPAEGVIIEVSRSKEIGISATMIIKSGTLKMGMFVVAGESVSPVRMMEDFQSNKIQSATFSSPIRVGGFDSVPVVGTFFHSFYSRKDAEEFIEVPRRASQTLKATPDSPEKFIIPVIIKADNAGIIEAIEYELSKMEADKVGLRVLYSAVGDITDEDIKIASGKASTLIIGFNAKMTSPTKGLAERLNVTVANFDIIYKLNEWLGMMVEEKTPKTEVEEKKGLAKILKLFSQTKDKQIIGGRVEEGTLTVGDDVKILRRDAEIGKGKIRELQQMKTKIKEIGADSEFGAMVESKMEIAAGDKLEAYVIVKK
jgi:translation initiation factor IF-2